MGLPDLEALATDKTRKFKVWLAERLWALHERMPGGLLAPGYTGPDDARLVAFIKETWMRRNYGARFGQTVRTLARDPVTFGPGWKSNVFSTGGVQRAESHWDHFRSTLPTWSSAVDMFLDACQHIGRSADPQRGVVFTDPLDGAEVHWNPIRRATKKLPAGARHYIEAKLPGVLVKSKRFIARPWRVDTRANGELAKRIAPCLIHTLDAYFNALVIEDLHAVGVEQLVAIHDSWLLPKIIRTDQSLITEYLYDDDGVPLPGEVILLRAIRDVGQEWLTGLRDIYNWFVTALTRSPYEDLATGARARWRQRVAEQRWPRFTAS